MLSQRQRTRTNLLKNTVLTFLFFSDAAGPSKNELKKRAKELEKEKKKAERLAKDLEQQKLKAAAEIVSLLWYPSDLVELNINHQDYSG